MEDTNYWITPLALLPGVALLVMSTAIRFGQLHDELHRRERPDGSVHGSARHLFRRARMLRNALVALYSSTALLAVSGMVGGVAELWMKHVAAVVLSLSAIAVGGVAYAAGTLIWESVLLLEVIEELREPVSD